MTKYLLVDDDDNIRTVALIGLEDEVGVEVIEATSGPEALKLAKDEKPDLILLDMMMPGMDGVKTLEALRADAATASIPVIFMTAKVQKHEIESYTKLGAAGVIVKPFDPLTLAEEITKILSAQPSKL